MKGILVPTDFSDSANNAIEYAVEIAKPTGAKLILFHVYNIPVVPLEANYILPAEELEKSTMAGLKKIAKTIHLKHGTDLKIECACQYGFAAEEINIFAEAHKVDLIVMGLESAGYLSEKLIGSITTSVMKKSKKPLLAIDKGMKYKGIKKIALACDYNETNNESAVYSLKEFTSLFNAQLYIINVVDELELVPATNEAAEAIKVEHLLKGFIHYSYYIKNDDTVSGINKFVEEMSIDMLVMIPHHHSALHNLFHEADSKHMAFHTKVPLLTLHQ